MFSTLLVVIFFIAQLSVGALASFNASLRCGTITPSPSERLRIGSDFDRRRKALRQDHRMEPIEVPVIFYVVYDQPSREGGLIDDNPMMIEQLNVLDAAYAKSGISFNLHNVVYFHAPEYYRKAYPGNQQSADMMNSVRTGGAETLNIYLVGFVEPPPNSPPILGYATFPWDSKNAPDLDATATHQVGHWLGLFHTFQTDDNEPKCEYGNGDFVADTPPQNGASSGCPIDRDSCPDDEGLTVDPIHNFMDLSDDACMNEFTIGQSQRLLDQCAAYRKPVA
ncbi:hypothetical protein CVT24_010172 [Panaeolus cyanescens]|uniref:Peptidase M43 pregnancy-associated plasma-A domain-containing protein n=1 Tax=Panaeolus cyanescens TaxID=181874 RepID=A0A409YW26_9AGAR|nr:hypothetical protein CVT24_010172 [Panaeolus cyanescens]